MPLVGDGLGALLHTKIVAVYGAAEDDSKLVEWCNAVGEAIVDYITANAQVTSEGTVTGGTAAGDPVATTGTIS